MIKYWIDGIHGYNVHEDNGTGTEIYTRVAANLQSGPILIFNGVNQC